MINPFGKNYSPKDLKLFEFLRALPLFSDLSNRELMYFLPYLYERNYTKDEVVFFRDDPAHALYIIRQGTVSVNIDIDDKTEELTSIGGGEMFGENCLLRDTKRSVNVIVSSDVCKMFVIPNDNLINIMNDHSSIRNKVMTNLAGHFEKRLKILYRNYRTSFGLFNLGDIYKT